MSQSGLRTTASGIGAVTTLTGDVGGAVGPNGAGNITLVGGNLIDTTGNPGGNSLTFDVVGGTDGQVIIGSTLGSPAFATITSSDASITFTPGANTLNMVVAGGFSDTFNADVGSATPVAGVITLAGGDNINTSAAGSTVTTHLNETIHWPDTNAAGTTGVIYLGGAGGVGGSRFMHNYGSSNTFFGSNAGNFTLNVVSSNQNTGIGAGALASLTTSDSNIALGYAAANSLTGGTGNNIVIGALGAFYLTTGGENDLIGTNIAVSGGVGGLATGTTNIIIGSGGDFASPAGSAYRGAESNNIIIRNVGVIGESNTIRIGTAGAGSGQQNSCFVAGIYGVNPALANERVVVMDSAGQLGTIGQANGELLIGSAGVAPVAATITAGAGITVANGAGSITISATGADLLAYTNVAVTPYAVLTTDEFLGVDCSGGIITVQLPNAPSTGRVFYIKDRTGNANINNITVTTVGGVVLIDGAATYTMNTQYAAISVLFDGSTFQVF